MVYGVLQLINFAHSEVFMYGTFAMAWVVVLIHGTASADQSLGSSLGLPAASAWSPRWSTSAVIALLVERLAYRPLIKRGSPQAGHPDLGDRRVLLAGRADGTA